MQQSGLISKRMTCCINLGNTSIESLIFKLKTSTNDLFKYFAGKSKKINNALSQDENVTFL